MATIALKITTGNDLDLIFFGKKYDRENTMISPEKKITISLIFKKY
jgi:hypothetical protein